LEYLVASLQEIEMDIQVDYINLTPENIKGEHICCVIRSKKPHAGIETKKKWLTERMDDGHVFRKLNVKGIVFIEYTPLETAWVPIVGENYYYMHCLWIENKYRGSGYGKELMDYLIADAKKNGKLGVCMLGSDKQKSWLSDQKFAKKYGFKVIDTTGYGYELLALTFDDDDNHDNKDVSTLTDKTSCTNQSTQNANLPSFSLDARNGTIESQELTIYYDDQCPYIPRTVAMIRSYCHEKNIPVSLIHIESLKQAKALPCVFNNFGVFYKGRFETVNLIDMSYLERILKK
jgi:ribosomal protein S18 acetylase RimI-like enzyme